MTDEWDFYPTLVDGEPAFIFVDLGVARAAPISGFGELACIRLWMKAPRPDGLSSNEEFETLRAIEDDLSQKVAASGASVYVGRNTCGGARDFYFYTRDRADFDRLAAAAMSVFPTYEFEVGGRPDEAWSVYFEFLCPDADQRRGMADRAVLEALERHGDDGTAPRPIDHLIILADGVSAAAVARSVVEQGFSLKPGSPSGGSEGDWLVEFDRVEVPADIEATTLMLSALARRHGGEYDGWGCNVVDQPAN